MTGGAVLNGRVRVTGAKNSALKLMAAALLATGPTTIDEVPDILDVAIMSEVLRRLGCEVTYERTGDGGGGGRVVVDVPEKPSTETDYDLVRKMRASINVLGPLVARCGSAQVALPGGDAIGSRGLDMHISGLERLGATIVSEHGFLVATAPRLTGTSIWLDFPSVGATENLRDGGRPGQRDDGHRQRGARAGDRRPLLDARRDGRRHRRGGHLDDHGRGRRVPLAGDVHDRARPDRRRHLGDRRGHDPRGRRHRAGRSPTT